MDRLVAETQLGEVEEIVIANVPHRIRGASVAGDFQAALSVLGARAMPVRVATWVSYPSLRAAALAGPPEWTFDESNPQMAAEVTVRLETRDGPFRRYVGPRLPADGSSLPISIGELAQEESGIVRVTLRATSGRALFAWDRGRLVPLLRPSAAGS